MTTRLLRSAFFAACIVSSGCNSSDAPAPDAVSSAAPLVQPVPAIASAADPTEDVVANFDVPIGNPTRDRAVVVAAAVFPPRAAPGGTVTLAVRARIAAGWHIGAVCDADRDVSGRGTSLAVELPPGIEPAGDWQIPSPATHYGPAGRELVYEGDVTFRRLLRIAADHPPGKIDFSCVITSQACNDTRCLRATPENLPVAIEIVGLKPGH